MRFEYAANAGFVERLYPKAKVIEVSPLNSRLSTTRTPQLTVDRHKINEGSAGPELHQTYRILSALDSAPQHIAIKVKHWT
jgi:hypothetical protein